MEFKDGRDTSDGMGTLLVSGKRIPLYYRRVGVAFKFWRDTGDKMGTLILRGRCIIGPQ